MIRRDFNGFAAAPSPQEIVNERVAAMVQVNDALYAALADFKSDLFSRDEDRMTWEVEQWHTNALKWMNSAQEATQSETKFKGWRTWGLTLSSSADNIFGLMGRSTWGRASVDFAKTFPSALGLVAKTGVQGAASVATQIAAGAGEAASAAGKGVGKTLLWVGIPLAAFFYVITSGGRSINLGPFKIGGGR